MASKKKRRQAKPAKAEPLEVCRKISDLYLLLVFGIFPLVVGTGEYGYANLVETKMWFWFGITVLWLLALAGYLVWCTVKKKKPAEDSAAGNARGKNKMFSTDSGVEGNCESSCSPVHIRFSWIHGAALAFLGVNIISALLSEYPRASFLQMFASNTNSVVVMAFYTAVFMGISLFGRLRREHILALGTSTFLSGILSEIQLMGYNPLTMYPEGLTYYNKHKEYAFAFLGTMGNIDYLAAFLCFAVPVLTVYAIRSDKKQDRILLIPALLSLHILYHIDVDAAKVGLMGCLILAFPVVIRNRRWAKYAGISCGAAVLLGLTAVYFWPGKHGFIYEASQILHGHIEPSFGHDRVEIWIKAWRSIVKKPILGNGPCSGSWLLKIQKVNNEMDRVNVVYNAHNTYIGYLMDIGILGLGCYLTLIGKGFIDWIRKRENSLCAALGAGIACYLIQDFFSINLVIVAPFLWTGLGLLAGEISGEN